MSASATAATRKLILWRSFLGSLPVGEGSLPTSWDLTMPPHERAGSFPTLPTWQLLTNSDLSQLFARAPSAYVTGWVSFLVGVLLTRLLSAFRRRTQPQSRTVGVVLAGAVLVLLQRWLRKRLTVLKPLSCLDNVSSSPLGPCRVVCQALILTNSHAGTHADTPLHFSRDDSTLESFADDHYEGAAWVVNIAALFPVDGPRAITREILWKFEQLAGVSLRDAWRLVFVTSSAGYVARKTWEDFAFFDPDGAMYLAESSRLLLVGIDTPSVDHPTRSPICDASHGVFHSRGVAILENLVLPQAVDVPLVAHGVLSTTFIAGQRFDDSRGCVVKFFPRV